MQITYLNLNKDIFLTGKPIKFVRNDFKTKKSEAWYYFLAFVKLFLLILALSVVTLILKSLFL